MANFFKSVAVYVFATCLTVAAIDMVGGNFKVGKPVDNTKVSSALSNSEQVKYTSIKTGDNKKIKSINELATMISKECSSDVLLKGSDGEYSFKKILIAPAVLLGNVIGLGENYIINGLI